jgi:5-formyltetrahydrofolate cyclo-ligase
MTAPDAAVDAKTKTTLRGQALLARNTLDEADRSRFSDRIAEGAAEIVGSLRPICVALYRPIGSECDTHALMVKVTALGAFLALPAIIDKTTIVFRRFALGDALVSGGFGTSFPATEVPVVEPDVIVLPVVAFDRTGTRLGYGRGYYDRAISRQREAGYDPRLVGIAFAVQEVALIPDETHDIRLDWVVTEREILDFAGMQPAGEA